MSDDPAAQAPTTELEAAQMVRDGLLDAGYRFCNINFWPLRITGTGVSWRSADKEFCYRPPETYLNDEFLARCNGLPVIFEHPEKGGLNSEEFHDRSVGNIMLPYLKMDDEEVWGVARIYDEATDAILRKYQMSTSPCVDFVKSENKSIIVDGDEKWLLEGKPILLDHLAICEQGVWDKQGEPSGVGSGVNAVAETEPEKKSDEEKPAVTEKKADAEHGGMGELHSKLDSIMDCLGVTTKRMDSVMERMDSFEEKLKKPDAEPEKKAEAEPEKKEEKKADSEKEEAEKKADKERADAAEATRRADADEIKRRLADAEEKLKEPAEEEREALADRQSKADSVFMQLGERAPAPMRGEKALDYRLRLAGLLQGHSSTWKDTKLSAIAKADSSAFANAESAIYADAERAARTPETKPGVLRMRSETQPTGHRVNTFSGDIGTWMAPPFRHRARLKSNAEIRGA